MRAYAKFLFAFRDPESGRTHFEQAVGYPWQTDNYGLWERMYTYLEWALSEAKFGAPSETEKLIAKAEETCKSLTNVNMKADGTMRVLPEWKRLISSTSPGASASGLHSGFEQK